MLLPRPSLADQLLYVGGRAVSAQAGGTFETLDPATNRVLCRVALAEAADVDAAVASAQAGFAEWSAWLPAKRRDVLLRAAHLLRERNDELAALEVLDTGKPLQEALVVDVASGADAIEYFAGLAPSLHGEHVDFGGAFAYTRREPLGVCVGIGAWNYPLQIACWKSAPALACGNAMVFKPAELTPLTAIKLAEIYTEAGVPDGVFNVVQGPASTGQCLTRHPDVAKISLTGEVGTGKRVMADAAGTLKHVTMELGGKSPLIVFDDADIDNAVSGAILANFYTQGEVCSNGTRVYVADGIRDSFLERLADRVSRMRVGDPLDPATHVGALISREHQQKVLGFIERARNSGARLLCGGGAPSDLHLADGNFVAPTVFTDCADDSELVQEEVFGPVMAVLGFAGQDEESVVARANDTRYGLAAGIFTQDLQRAHRVAAKLEAGICWINTYNITPVEVPFGGYKESGLGRENGRMTLEQYTQVKTVYVELGDVEAPY